MFETPGETGAEASSEVEATPLGTGREVDAFAKGVEEGLRLAHDRHDCRKLTCDACEKGFKDNQPLVYAKGYLFCNGFCRTIGPRQPDGTTSW